MNIIRQCAHEACMCDDAPEGSGTQCGSNPAPWLRPVDLIP